MLRNIQLKCIFLEVIFIIEPSVFFLSYTLEIIKTIMSYFIDEKTET